MVKKQNLTQLSTNLIRMRVLRYQICIKIRFLLKIQLPS